MEATQTAQSPVTLTISAINAVKELLASSTEGDYLRIGVKGGGCSGMSYVLGFDNKTADDQEYDIEGVKVVMNNAHGIYLMGIEVDYHDGLDNRGFTFNNPNASNTCGCGNSFAI